MPKLPGVNHEQAVKLIGKDSTRDGMNWYLHAGGDPVAQDELCREEILMRVSFSIPIRGETFHITVRVDLSTSQVIGDLKRVLTSESGQRWAMFIFLRHLGRSDSALSMHIKLLDDTGDTEEVWHAVVSLSGQVLHMHQQ